MRVRVHWNLHRGGWSITHKGRVIDHVEAVCLADLRFLVSAAGHATMLREGRRRVCAWAEGDLVRVPSLVESAGRQLAGRGVAVRFDRERGCFHVNGERIHRARWGVFRVHPEDAGKGRGARNQVAVLP